MFSFASTSLSISLVLISDGNNSVINNGIINNGVTTLSPSLFTVLPWLRARDNRINDNDWLR